MFGKFEKRPATSLVKRVRLTPKEFHYRLALEKADHNRKNIDYDGYYEGLTSVLDARDKVWLWNSLAFAALFLFYLGALDDFDFFGISIDAEIIGHVLFLLYSLTTVLFANQQAKVFRYQSVFNSAHDRSTGSQKQHMILRYPRANGPMHYANWMSGGPRYMFPVKRIPRRVMILLVAMVPALLAWLGFTAWLLIRVSIQLWATASDVIGMWSQTAVIVGWIGFIMATLLPTIAVKKMEFDHFGLSELLTQSHRNRPARYSYYVELIARTDHGSRVFQGNDNTEQKG